MAGLCALGPCTASSSPRSNAPSGLRRKHAIGFLTLSLLPVRSLSAAYKGAHALLMQEGGEVFRTGQTFDQTAFFDEDVDLHHIFQEKWCRDNWIDEKVCDSVIDKAPLSYRTNQIIGGVAPSDYLNRLASVASKDPPIKADVLDQMLRTRCIDPGDPAGVPLR